MTLSAFLVNHNHNYSGPLGWWLRLFASTAYSLCNLQHYAFLHLLANLLASRACSLTSLTPSWNSDIYEYVYCVHAVNAMNGFNRVCVFSWNTPFFGFCTVELFCTFDDGERWPLARAEEHKSANNVNHKKRNERDNVTVNPRYNESKSNERYFKSTQISRSPSIS